VRYFVAVCPPQAVIDDIAGMTAGWSSGGQASVVEPAQRWHVTVRFLGAVTRTEPLVAALRQECAAAPSVMVTYGPATIRLTEQALVVPITGLTGLAEGVQDVIEPWGDVPASRPFVGHLTLVRNRRPKRHGGLIPQAWVGVPVGGSWLVETMGLFVSEVVAGVPHYRVVQEFPLAG